MHSGFRYFRDGIEEVALSYSFIDVGLCHGWNDSKVMSNGRMLDTVGVVALRSIGGFVGEVMVYQRSALML